MEAIVFSSTAALATRIRSSDDLETELAAEPLVVSSPGVFVALVKALGLDSAASPQPLRDATCQSFPVWIVARVLGQSLKQLGEDDVDDLVEAWREGLGGESIDADPYELSTWIVEIRQALQENASADEQLFILFEEKAMF